MVQETDYSLLDSFNFQIKLLSAVSVFFLKFLKLAMCELKRVLKGPPVSPVYVCLLLGSSGIVTVAL